jgi:hypothetical protein
MQPPTYLEVVERYGLEILNRPADLVVTAGSIAKAKGGDLMMLNAEYSAMSRLVHGWRFNAPTLQLLFDQVSTIRRRGKELEDRLKASGSGWADPVILGRYRELRDEKAANELGGTAYAGAIVLVLTGLLQAFKDDMDATWDDWNRSGPLIENCSVGAVLAASANNFRHNDEWLKDRGDPTDKQLRSICILAAALRKPIAANGVNHPFGAHVCQETLELLSQGSFDKLSANLFDFANSMVIRRERATG